MMNLSITFSFAILLVGSVAAESKQCPPTSTGQYPKCICPQKDYPYDEINNICSIKLNFEKIPCPNGSSGYFPKCICKQDEVYDPEKKECVIVDKSQCPDGSKKVDHKCVCNNRNGFAYKFDEIFWLCRPWYLPGLAPSCEFHKHLVNGKCEWDSCPLGYTPKDGYWPNCTAPQTCQQQGLIGQWPNCIVAPPLPCPKNYVTKTGYWPDCTPPQTCASLNLVGTYPNCIERCPPHHYLNSKNECVRIPCAAPHQDLYQPDCPVFLPECPPEYPGTWPYCNIYASTTQSPN